MTTSGRRCGWSKPSECVVGLYRHTGHIRGTEQRVESEVGALFYFTGEKISRVVTYGTWAEALRAAGVDS